MTIDINLATEYGLLIRASYDIPPDDLDNMAGKQIDPKYDPFKKGYTILSTIYGLDLTLRHADLGDEPDGTVSFGLVAQDASGKLVVALRGTEGDAEWINNGFINRISFPFVPNAGKVHSGFEWAYSQLHAKDTYGDNRLVFAVIGLPPKKPTAMAICGHSLGAALATMLAIDAVANTEYRPDTYLFASPMTGNRAFVSKYNQLVPNTYRLVNVCDLVPKIPPGILYDHVSQPINLFASDVQPNESCWHDMRTYLHLLSQLGTPQYPQPLAEECVVAAARQISAKAPSRT